MPDVEGPTHRYIGASPGCWAEYGRLLEREYGDYARYAPIHRLTVDAYAAQHPGDLAVPQAVQSVAVHLIRLCLQLELGLPHERANDAMIRISSRTREFAHLEPPSNPGWLTVLDVIGAIEPEDHTRRVRRWAASVWEAWRDHHETVRQWAGDGSLPGRSS